MLQLVHFPVAFLPELSSWDVKLVTAVCVEHDLRFIFTVIVVTLPQPDAKFRWLRECTPKRDVFRNILK
jgi:hypothetical protein